MMNLRKKPHVEPCGSPFLDHVLQANPDGGTVVFTTLNLVLRTLFSD